MTRVLRLPVLIAAMIVAMAGGGCTGSGHRQLTVFAAASLTKVFTELGARFEATHPGVAMRFTFDGSSGLVDQLKGGARADVFASADDKNMTNAVTAKLTTGEPVIFARNVLTLVVPPGNPGRITGLNSSLDGRKLVVCAPEVPCGSGTVTLSKQLGVTLKPVSEESKVTDVLGKVTSQEADAGIVYVTDAKGAGDKVETIAIPGADRVVNDYPITLLTGAQQPLLATEFIALVTSADGQAVLAEAGFRAP